MNVKNVKMIDALDWDKLVTKTYKKPYTFQQQDGCKIRGVFEITIPVVYPHDYGNDTVPEAVNHVEMGVSFRAWLERDPKKPVKTFEYAYQNVIWWERNFYPHIEILANDLYKKRLIEAGDYLINIDW